MSAATRTITTDESARTLRTADLLILSIGTFTLGVDGFALSGLLPQVASSLRVAASTAGQLTTLFALVYALGSPVIAALTGSWDRRMLLATGMSVFVAGMVVQAVGPNFAAVAVGRVLAALGAAGYQATAYSAAGILSDDEHRARSLAIVAAGSSVALVAGLPFGILVGQTWGWRAAMWVLVVLAALSTLAVLFLPAAHAPKLGLGRRAGALTDRRVLAVLAAIVPQQVGLFATVPKLAPIAVGLNGSVIYTGSALGAAVGGLTLATAGPAAPAIAAAAIGLLGVIVAATVVPERIRASRDESTSC